MKSFIFQMIPNYKNEPRFDYLLCIYSSPIVDTDCQVTNFEIK